MNPSATLVPRTRISSVNPQPLIYALQVLCWKINGKNLTLGNHQNWKLARSTTKSFPNTHV
jgi:hypothetical protein